MQGGGSCGQRDKLLSEASEWGCGGGRGLSIPSPGTLKLMVC